MLGVWVCKKDVQQMQRQGRHLVRLMVQLEWVDVELSGGEQMVDGMWWVDVDLKKAAEILIGPRKVNKAGEIQVNDSSRRKEVAPISEVKRSDLLEASMEVTVKMIVPRDVDADA